MKAILITIIMILPSVVFGQTRVDDYGIYSNDLRVFNQTRGGEHNFVVRVSTDYGTKGVGSDIWSVLEDFRDYVKGKGIGQTFSRNQFLIDTLKTDTLWLPLISRLDQNMLKRHNIQNRFSKDLKVFLLAVY